MTTLYHFLTTNVFTKLNERQVRCVMARQKDVFGFGENLIKYKDIATQENISLERARQITMKSKRMIAFRLRQIAEAQKSPHIIIKNASTEELKSNLPMRQKFIYDLGYISSRTWNCLKNEDALLVDRLLEKTEKELLKVPNFGRKSLNELKQILAQHGLELRNTSLK